MCSGPASSQGAFLLGIRGNIQLVHPITRAFDFGRYDLWREALDEAMPKEREQQRLLGNLLDEALQQRAEELHRYAAAAMLDS